MEHTKVCPICSTVFHYNPSTQNNKTYCSSSCQKEAARRRNNLKHCNGCGELLKTRTERVAGFCNNSGKCFKRYLDKLKIERGIK